MFLPHTIILKEVIVAEAVVVIVHIPKTKTIVLKRNADYFRLPALTAKIIISF